MRCKFCGCTDDNACRVPVMFDEQEPGGAMIWAGDPEQADGFMPCYWLAPEICSAPACVKSAYEEARSIASLPESSRIIVPDVSGLSASEIERGLFRL